MVKENRKVPRRGRPPTGEALSAAERMRNSRARRKASGFRVNSRWVPAEPAMNYFSAHRLAEIRSLAMHALIVLKINRDPNLLEIPRQNLKRWAARSPDQPLWLKQWQDIMNLPWPEIATAVTSDSHDAIRLRQSTPFAGVLSEQERHRVYEAFRA